MLSLGTSAPFWVDWQKRAGWAARGSALHLLYGKLSINGVNKLYTDPSVDLVRASDAWGLDADGVVQQFDPGVVRATNAGVYTGPSIEQHFPNPSMAGVAVGVTGSGGSLPTDWDASGFDRVEIVAIGQGDGFPWVELQLDKDNSAGGSTAYPRLRGNSGFSPAAILGDNFTSSIWADAVSSNQQMYLLAEEKDGANSYEGASPVNLNAASRYWVTREVTSADTVSVILQVGCAIPVGEVLSCRIRLGSPNLTKTAYLAQPILDDGVQAADKLGFDLSGIDLSNGVYGVWRGEVAGWNDNWDRVLELGSTSGHDHIMLRATGTGDQLRLSFYDVSEAVNEPAPVTGNFLWSGSHEIVFGIGPNFTQLIIDGMATSVADLLAYSSVDLTTLFLGISHTGGSSGTLRTDELKLFVAPADGLTTELLQSEVSS
ncbi:hypothetical protein [Cohaesibacter celericrescens]|uniref:Uncharacterized protein n=1 Tax=Cohaesibacter celericrescens TaxID=2067669 RepID=A0A2N5XQP8_9HYPH|nr:hypothetical protein [Cohaesibacter celericrescens]PLW76795.1 hypothetical protein C0081_12090 [Cohaesibacter celericrescens]